MPQCYDWDGALMNKQVIGAVVFVGATGIIVSWTKKQPITKVILGSYILLFVLSILDLLGGPLRKLAGGLAMITVVYVLLNEFPWDQIIALAQGKAAK